MGGIVGAWNVDGRPLEQGSLDAMLGSMAHRGPDGLATWIEGPIGLGSALMRVTPESVRETQPFVHPDGAVVVFDGRLDNRSELLAALRGRRDVDQRVPDLQLVCAAYEVYGEAFASRLLGDFAFAIFDPRRQHLLLARDAMGVRPLHYLRTRTTFLFASEIKSLLAHPVAKADPNPAFLARVLLKIPLLQEDEEGTFFRDVHSIPPANIAVVAPGRHVRRRYWDFDGLSSIRLASFDEYTEAFRHHFEVAVRRRLRSRSPVAVSVSGGVDSSAILCTGLHLRGEAATDLPSLLGFAFSAPSDPRADEEPFLRAIEETYDIQIERIEVRPTAQVPTQLASVRISETPIVNPVWATTARLFESARGSGASVLLTGHWGDQVLVETSYLVDLVDRLAWRRALQDLREAPRWVEDATDPQWFVRQFLSDLVRHHTPSRVFPYLQEARARHASRGRTWLSDGARRGALGRPPAVPPRWRFETRHARGLYGYLRSPMHRIHMEWTNKAASAFGIDAAFPFLDQDLLSFLMAIPGEEITHGGVPKAIVRYGLRTVLPEEISRRRSKGDLSAFAAQGLLMDWPEVVQRLVDVGAAESLGLADGDALRRALPSVEQSLRSGDASTAYRLTELLGLELFLEVYAARPIPFS